MHSKKEAALQYAGRGWRVFPIHSIREGACTCGRDCKNAAKHPRVKGGYKAGSVSGEEIEKWWSTWPDANIGIATGRISSLLVLDIDGEEGLETLASIRPAPLPPVATVRTGRGFHLYYSCDQAVPCSAGGGLDVRGDGGYVVAPPSVHASGHVYHWVQP